MNEKLHNEDFDVKRIDGEALSGDSNKIKLKITSYTIIMEVQEAYMKEEIKAKEEKAKELEDNLKASNLSAEEKEAINKEIMELQTEVNSLYDAFVKFTESNVRFMDLAKKALKLPDINFKELEEKGFTKINGQEVKVEEFMKPIESSFEETQSVLNSANDEDIFSNVDSDLIKQEVERAMNEEGKDRITGEDIRFGDQVAEKVNSEDLEKITTAVAKEIKENVDEIKKDEIKIDDVDSILEKAGALNLSKSPSEQQTEYSAISDQPEKTEEQQKEATTKEEVKAEPDSSIIPGEWQNVPLEGVPTLDNKTDSKQYDFSEDEEIIELKRQLAETKQKADSADNTLKATIEKRETLEKEKSLLLEEASQKYEEAAKKQAEMEEIKRAEAKAKLMSEMKAELESYKDKIIVSTKKSQDEETNIAKINSEISGYNASIEKSDSIINEYNQMLSQGGRTK